MQIYFPGYAVTDYGVLKAHLIGKWADRPFEAGFALRCGGRREVCEWSEKLQIDSLYLRINPRRKAHRILDFCPLLSAKNSTCDGVLRT